MTQYSLLDRRPEEETLQLLHKNNIGVLVRGSLGQGLLINKPAKSYLDYPAEDVAKISASVHKLSGEKRSATQTAIKFVLQNETVTSAVVGMRTFEQVEEAVNTVNVPDLTKVELDMLRTTLQPLIYKEHR